MNDILWPHFSVWNVKIFHGKIGLYLVVLKYTWRSNIQRKWNSLLGDVVFGSFNKVYRDENNILDQTYQEQICSDFYFEDF